MRFYALKYGYSNRGYLFSVIIFVIITALFISIFNTISSRSEEQEALFIKNALDRAAITCFAIEGRYPRALDYLLDHYGIQYSEEKFIVSYAAFASNIFPDIAVLRVGENP